MKRPTSSVPSLLLSSIDDPVIVHARAGAANRQDDSSRTRVKIFSTSIIL